VRQEGHGVRSPYGIAPRNRRRSGRRSGQAGALLNASLWYIRFMRTEVVDKAVSLVYLRQLAETGFGNLVKAVVDVERRLMAVGGELHADEEAVLLEQGSDQYHLWGINIYPDLPKDERVEFDSMINIRPARGNRSRGVDDPATRESILRIVEDLVRE
jgi:hypothetical protein